MCSGREHINQTGLKNTVSGGVQKLQVARQCVRGTGNIHQICGAAPADRFQCPALDSRARRIRQKQAVLRQTPGKKTVHPLPRIPRNETALPGNAVKRRIPFRGFNRLRVNLDRTAFQPANRSAAMIEKHPLPQ